jgi:hypothetical protein
MEKLMEWLTGEAEVLGENLPQCLFVHHKSHLTGRRGGKPATNRLIYVTASLDFTFNPSNIFFCFQDRRILEIECPV